MIDGPGRYSTREHGIFHLRPIREAPTCLFINRNAAWYGERVPGDYAKGWQDFLADGRPASGSQEFGAGYRIVRKLDPTPDIESALTVWLDDCTEGVDPSRLPMLEKLLRAGLIAMEGKG
jgi:hypothetical protein